MDNPLGVNCCINPNTKSSLRAQVPAPLTELTCSIHR